MVKMRENFRGDKNPFWQMIFCGQWRFHDILVLFATISGKFLEILDRFRFNLLFFILES